jgi:hypothetical protein
MGTGFNIAVAPFTVLAGVTTPEVGMEVGDWLFKAITGEALQLPLALGVNTRGPDELQPVVGQSQQERWQNADILARQHQATILIYGTVFMGETGLQVRPEFHVSGEDFDYGSDVRGPAQLGQPVTVDTSLGTVERYDLNVALNGRAQAMRYLVTGLAHFFIREYADAANDFEKAADVTTWRDGEGKEVVYLLLGAAYLRQYDQIANPTPLLAAESNFRQAYAINPAYGRAYLGLGAVARAQAALLCADGTAICGADPHKLVEARDWYSGSLQTAEQPPTAYIPIKAAHGLGQVHLLGFELGIPGWSDLEAERYFQQVIVAYEENLVCRPCSGIERPYCRAPPRVGHYDYPASHSHYVIR